MPRLSYLAQLLILSLLLSQPGSLALAYGGLAASACPSPSSEFVTVKDGHFWLQGKRLHLHGVNYWPSYSLSLFDPGKPSTWNCYQWWMSCDYRASEVEADLRKIREMRMNLIAISGPREDDASSSSLSNLRHLLSCARQNVLFVLLCQSFSITIPSSQAIVNYANRIRTLNLVDDPTLIGYDIAWEPHLGTKNERQHLNDEWTEWVLNKYGSLQAAESYWNYQARVLSTSPFAISDPEDQQLTSEGAWSRYVTDYWRFAHDWANTYFRPIVEAIREVDPNHLVTVRNGFGGNGNLWANSYVPPDISVGADFLDFLSPEGYSLPGTVGGSYEWQVAGVYCKEDRSGRWGPEQKIWDNPSDHGFDFIVIPKTLDLVDPSLWPPPPAFTPVPGNVSGRVARGDNGQPLANVRIETCTGSDVLTDANGYFQFHVRRGQGYCVRVRMEDAAEVLAINLSQSLIEEHAKITLATFGFITSYARWATRDGKPVVWLEFGQSLGLFPTPRMLEAQKRFYQYVYEAALEYDVDGVVAWWYPGGPRLDEKSDFGIVNNDNSDRPVAETIRWYASQLGVFTPRPVDMYLHIVHGTQDPLGFAGVLNRYLQSFENLLLEGKKPAVRFPLEVSAAMTQTVTETIMRTSSISTVTANRGPTVAEPSGLIIASILGLGAGLLIGLKLRRKRLSV